MASLQLAIRVGRDEGDDVRFWRRNDLDHNRDGPRSETPQGALFPRGDECPNGVVVEDGGAGACEREPPARAFPAAAHRPRGRRAAAFAEGRLDPRQAGKAGGAELRTPQTADHAALRQEQVEHPRKLRRVPWRLRQERITNVKLLLAAAATAALALTGCGGSKQPAAMKAISRGWILMEAIGARSVGRFRRASWARESAASSRWPGRTELCSPASSTSSDRLRTPSIRRRRPCVRSVASASEASPKACRMTVGTSWSRPAASSSSAPSTSRSCHSRAARDA